jgi:hypothetical protein
MVVYSEEHLIETSRAGEFAVATYCGVPFHVCPTVAPYEGPWWSRPRGGSLASDRYNRKLTI